MNFIRNIFNKPQHYYPKQVTLKTKIVCQPVSVSALVTADGDAAKGRESRAFDWSSNF